MTIADLSIAVLALLFVGTLVPRFSLGLAAFPAAFLVATAAGVSPKELTGFFPSDFFVLIVGVTALFAVAQATGTMEWILAQMLKLVRGRLAFVPLLTFVLGFAITAIGTLPAAAVAIMAPIAMGLAARYTLPPLLMALVTMNGILAGLFSPIAVFGVSTMQLYKRVGVDVTPLAALILMIASLGLGLLLCSLYLAIGWRHLRGSASEPHSPNHPIGAEGSGNGVSSAPPVIPAPARGGGPAVLTPAAAVQRNPTATALPNSTARAVMLGAFVVLIAGAVGFKIDIGYLALTLAAVLQLVFRIEPASIVSRIPWGIILLIGGLLSYVGLMEHIGAFTRISELVTVHGSPTLTLLAICYIAGITSFFASSLAVLATSIALLPPLIAAGVSPVGAIVALALSCVLVDINPLGPTGGLILGAAAPQHRTALFRQLLIYGLGAVVIAPPLMWAAFSWI
jgi:di/tricarboxylate transporter